MIAMVEGCWFAIIAFLGASLILLFTHYIIPRIINYRWKKYGRKKAEKEFEERWEEVNKRD